MRLKWIIGGVVAAVILSGAPGAGGAPLEPGATQIAHAAATCTAKGAFGFRFGDRYMGHWVDTTLPPEQAPFTAATIGLYRLATHMDAHYPRIYQVEAFADFQKKPSTYGTWPLAERFFQAINAQIVASHRFAVREVLPSGSAHHHYGGALYRSSATLETGYTLKLTYDLTLVKLTCTDLVRKQLAK